MRGEIPVPATVFFPRQKWLHVQDAVALFIAVHRGEKTMRSQTRRVSTMMGTVAGVMLLAFVSSGGLSQAEEPTAPPPSQKKAVKKGDPGQVQEPTVSLTQAVHFTDAKGQDVVVGPGSYRVAAEGTNRIRLLPSGTGGAVVIDAVSFTHQQPVERPVPVTTPDPQQPDVLNLALLLPGGHGVGAVGTYSGVKPRAVTNWTAVYALGAYSYQPAPVVRDHRRTGGMTLQGNTLTAMPGYVLEIQPGGQEVVARRAGAVGLTGPINDVCTADCSFGGACIVTRTSCSADLNSYCPTCSWKKGSLPLSGGLIRQ